MTTGIKWKAVTFERLPIGTIFIEEQPVTGFYTISIKETDQTARQLSTTNPHNYEFDGTIVVEDDLYENIYFASLRIKKMWDHEIGYK